MVTKLRPREDHSVAEVYCDLTLAGVAACFSAKQGVGMGIGVGGGNCDARPVLERREWYQVTAGHRQGYLHNTWVRLDQFVPSTWNHRHVQIKSFRDLRAAEEYVNGSPLDLSAPSSPRTA